MKSQKKETWENKKQYYGILLQDSSGTLWGTIWEELMEDCHEDLKGTVVAVKALSPKTRRVLSGLLYAGWRRQKSA